jgi:Family of unknown function (DUF6504)
VSAARDEFVSEPLRPAGPRDTAAMGRGEPGLPAAFEWRGRRFDVLSTQAAWKESSPEGRRAGNEVYLRRHCYRLRMSDGSVWSVYFTRQAPRGGSARQRWFLYSRAETQSAAGVCLDAPRDET